ncbi:hypothetical protein DERF_007465 [Dermatophagoides farinae]|nr:hypothetical protein DERF_007465 [Dermatophagoides farinae]
MHHSRQLLCDIGSVKNWQRVQTLGSGTFATITLWVNKDTDERIALKQNYMDVERYSKKQITYYYERWQQEITFMKQLKCENVVKALELPKEFSKLSLGMPILAMEYCSGGDLRKVLNEPTNCCGLSEKEVRQILKQISSAINCLHNLNIVHRDLKPENIVLQPLPHGKILYKLTDLGYAKQLSETTSANSFVGTFEYLAPELFLNIPYTSSVDNWSFGVIAYEIITGRRPFLPNHPVTEVLEAIKKKKSDDICTEIDERGNFYYSKEISQLNYISSILKSDLEKWLKTVLQFDPKKRGGRDAFKEIKQIVNKRNVQIFSIFSYETFAYEITEETHIDDLKEKIFASSNIIPANQYLFFQNGDLLKEKIGQQIIQTWYTPKSWFDRYNPITINMFDYSKEVNYQEFYKFLCLPNRVEMMLMNCDQTADYDELKFTWRSSVFVARQTVAKYRFVHETLKSCILNAITMFNRLQNEDAMLYNSLNQMFSTINAMEKLLKKNYLKFSNTEETNDDVKDSNHISSSSSSSIFMKLKNLHDWRNNIYISGHFERNGQIVPKFDKEKFMFEDFFQSPEIDESLMNKYVDIQKAYDMLRKLKKDEYKKYASNNLMVKLLCDIFKLVETLMKKMFSLLSILISFIRNIRNQQRDCQRIKIELDKWKTNELEELQQMIFRKTYHEYPSSTESSTEFLASQVISLDGCKDSINRQIEILSEFERENSQWQSKAFVFESLEFKDFLF